jgi:hypothetical protein
MQSRTLLNIALFLLVVVLAIYMYVTDQQHQEIRENEQLTQLSADEITQIEIRHNQRHISLQKQNGIWRMLQPVRINANGFRIDTILKMLDTVSHAAYPAAGLELEKYGISGTSTSVSFNGTTIDFGILNPINNFRYVRVADTVHLIDDHFYPLLSSQTGTLVARELIPEEAEIEKIVLPEVTLYRDENDAWHSNDAVEPDAINEILYQWKHAQAFGVHNYMQREPIAEIRLQLADNPDPVQLYITDTDPWLIIARPDLDLEYHFNPEFYDRLLKPGVAVKAPQN